MLPEVELPDMQTISTALQFIFSDVVLSEPYLSTQGLLTPVSFLRWEVAYLVPRRQLYR